MSLTKEQREDLRHVVLEALVTRYPAALSPRQIERAVRKLTDFDFSEADAAGALQFLKDELLADYTTDELGSTNYWRATSQGVKEQERQ